MFDARETVQSIEQKVLRALQLKRSKIQSEAVTTVRGYRDVVTIGSTRYEFAISGGKVVHFTPLEK